MAESPAAIESLLSLAQKTTAHSAIRQAVVFHRGDLTEILSRRLSKLQIDFTLINPSSNAFQITMPATTETGYLEGVFAILPSSNPCLNKITTISSSIFWARTIRKLVRKLYPEAMPVFFKQSEIREALLFLEQSLGEKFQIKVSDATMKSEKRKGDFNTERGWADELSIDESFDIASERGFWFSSLKFLIKKRTSETGRFRTVASGRLHKYGEVHFEWFYNEITSYLVAKLENFAAERLSLFEKRGIKERNYKVGFPLEISYSGDIFSDIQEVRRFGEVISKYPNSSKAVFHGNPYYHASVADFLDGSSFEIWVLSPRRTIIVPQVKSTTQALERLISYVFYEFKEGTVSEYRGD